MSSPSPTKPDFSRLPDPDTYGNFYFGKPGDGDSPAIFKVGSNPREESYFVSLGRLGVVFDGVRLRTYKSPKEALKEIRTRLEGKEGK